MATYGEWIKKSTYIGGCVGGFVGFGSGAYYAVTNAKWAGGFLGIIEGLLLMFGGGSLVCGLSILAGWLVGMLIGIVSSPLSSFTRIRPLKNSN
jgi:hypothetical protein